MDRENSCEGMQLFAPKTKQINLFFSGSPCTSLPRPRPCWITTLGRALQCRLSCSLPDYRHYSPPPTKCLRLCSARLGQVGLRPAPKQMASDRTGCLPELDMFPPVAKLCLWYMCFCAEVFFFCSHTVLPMEHSLGVNFFFSSLSSCKCCIFLPFPVFLFCLPHCQMYVVYVWTGWWLISLVLVTSDNKGLLLLLLLLLEILTSKIHLKYFPIHI